MVTVDQMMQELEATGYCWSIANDRLGFNCRIFGRPQGNHRYCIIETGGTVQDAVRKALLRHNRRIKDGHGIRPTAS